MNLTQAEVKAKYLLRELSPFCEKIEVVGNIRRRKPSIDNIDILLVPKGMALFELMAKIAGMGFGYGIKIAEKKMVILKDDTGDIRANLWFTSLDKWSVMLFVKTGGNKTVKKIETLCRNKKWVLSVGKGVVYDEGGERLPIDKEEDIFRLLEIPYITPDWRE